MPFIIFSNKSRRKNRVCSNPPYGPPNMDKLNTIFYFFSRNMIKKVNILDPVGSKVYNYFKFGMIIFRKIYPVSNRHSRFSREHFREKNSSVRTYKTFSLTEELVYWCHLAQRKFFWGKNPIRAGELYENGAPTMTSK